MLLLNRRVRWFGVDSVPEKQRADSTEKSAADQEPYLVPGGHGLGNQVEHNVSEGARGNARQRRGQEGPAVFATAQTPGAVPVTLCGVGVQSQASSGPDF
jgi:hypothetical protein